MSSVVRSTPVVPGVRYVSRTWAPTIGDLRLVTGGRIRLDGPRFPRKLSAYHEAAHAVVAWQAGVYGGAPRHRRSDGPGRGVRPRDAGHLPGAGLAAHPRDAVSAGRPRQQERAAMALRQRDASTATAALAGVALEDIARAVPALDLLPAMRH